MTSELATRGDADSMVSDIVKMFGMVMVISLMTSMISNMFSPSPLAQYVQAQTYRGVSDPRDIEVTDELSFIDLVGDHPYTPWVSANFINDGPDSAKIAVNYPTALYELKDGESASVYRIGAQERIAVVFFICDRGERSSLRVIGEY